MISKCVSVASSAVHTSYTEKRAQYKVKFSMRPADSCAVVVQGTVRWSAGTVHRGATWQIVILNQTKGTLMET